MKKYYIHIPGWAFAMTAYGNSKSDALAKFKAQHGMTRMPNGYGIWEN
jgi:hypothetical protein